MNASFSGVSRVGTDGRQGEESCGSLVKAQASARVDVPTAPLFCSADGPRSPPRVYKFFVYQEFWICARPTTDRDLESQRHEKVDAWICARPTTHHDLAKTGNNGNL